ncbi:hypothetical protein DFJ73DRAFT_410162 [Zopfochytrium polystomum]|nr:hypothetical protein DFJ73DRAFT_410162 [Zopfochytrium polystomum]
MKSPPHDCTVSSAEDESLIGHSAVGSEGVGGAVAVSAASARSSSGDLFPLSPEEHAALLCQVLGLKDAGNALFKQRKWIAAKEQYDLAIDLCPEDAQKDLAVLHSNAAACLVQLGKHEEAVKECDKALELDPNFLRALVRRATAGSKLTKASSLYQALEDWKKIKERDRTQSAESDRQIRELTVRAAAAANAEKQEMLDKLKQVGSQILGKFGISMDNIKFTQSDGGGGGGSFSFENK